MTDPAPPFELWLEWEALPNAIDDPADDFANITVTLPDGRTYGLNVWAFAFMRRARYLWPYQKGTGEPAEYLLPPDLFVERLDRPTLERVVNQLLANGEMPPMCLVRNPRARVLETDRLTLRRFSTDDGPFMLELLNDSFFIRFVGDRGVRTVEAAREYLAQGPIDSYGRHGYGLYLVELKDGRIPIGMCGLLKRDFLSDPDIGFAFLPAFWSNGYAFEAASAVMTHARNELNLQRVVAVVSPGNERSVKLLLKLGMTAGGTIKWPDGGAEVEVFASNRTP
jgi:RimJ/RimL family protein N-acetyltransferase